MKTLALILALGALPLLADQRWAATTGDVSLSGAGTTATIQQPATGGTDVIIDQIVVYCSVACNVTQAANGSAATATTGTISPILPITSSLSAPANFFTASNVGAGTAQGGVLHVPAATTAVLCTSKACGATADVRVSAGGGTGSNYSVVISSITGTANITLYLRSAQ